MSAKTGVLLKIDSTPGVSEPLVLRMHSPNGGKRRGAAFVTDPRAKGSVYLYATGGAGGYVFAIVGGSAYDGLPPGLSLNTTTGMITGTPTTVGRYRFRAQVQDSSATVAEEDFTLDIIGQLHAGNVSPLTGEVGIAYSYQFSVTGNTGSILWSVIDGTVPDGLTTSAVNGTLSGTPTTDGYSYFVVRAKDLTTGDTLDVNVRMYIAPALQVFLQVFLRYAEVGIPVAIDASIPTGDYTGPATGVGPWTYSVEPGSDSWLTIDSQGIIRGTAPASAISPTVAGIPNDTITFTYRVTDSLGATFTNVVIGGVIPGGGAQSKLQPMKNGSDVGDPGPYELNLVEGSGIEITATNDGTRATYTISSTGGGADVATIRKIAALRAY